MRRGDERLLRPVREASALPALRAGLEAIALVKLLEEQGNLLRRPQPGALGDGLFELRGKQVRLSYLFLPGRVIVLLGGEIKKRDDIPAGTLGQDDGSSSREGQGAGPAALVELLEGVSGPGLGGDVWGELLLVEATCVASPGRSCRHSSRDTFLVLNGYGDRLPVTSEGRSILLGHE
jgi:hypothetical protein